jgi:tRNA-Thr(GGU) m(6)t(6)A37 methyltransferase TsaA
MHDVKRCDIHHVPQGKTGEVPEVGIFACRCPQRPNPIGLTTTKIISIDRNIVKVKGLDVISGTPVIDIKPYTPQYDFAENAKVPEWVNKLQY